LLPPPRRALNNYRLYSAAAVERLRFIASARRLGFSLADVGEILAARDQGLAPCERVLAALDQCRLEMDRRLADMLILRETLLQLRQEGAGLPLNDVDGQTCVCYLVKAYGETGRVVIQHTSPADEPKVRP
jgi:MerR family copper efflux transcriptional regulator